jgi:hypothetical protein
MFLQFFQNTYFRHLTPAKLTSLGLLDLKEKNRLPNYSARISGQYDGFKDTITDGRRPTSAYFPRFRNVFKQETNFLRDYAAGFDSGRSFNTNMEGFGKRFCC